MRPPQIRPDFVEIVRKKLGEFIDETNQVHVSRPADEQEGHLKPPARIVKRFI